MPPLPINGIRALADELGLIEIQHRNADNLIAFSGGPSRARRINVWYTTGTVGTYIDHPRQGKTQLFRRGVDMALLRKIFVNPRHHTNLGYRTRRGRSRSLGRSMSRSRSRSRGRSTRSRRGRSRSADSVGSNASARITEEEEAARKQKRRLEREMDALRSEMRVVQGILDDFERRREEERGEAARRETAARTRGERDARGREFLVWVDQSDRDWVWEQLGPETLCVALGGDDRSEVVVLQEGGIWAHTGGAPEKIVDLFNQRPDHSSPAKYISLGSMDRYYFEVENGNFWWNGPQAMGEVLKRSERSVKSIAFGETYGTFFIVWVDGDYEWQGDIPSCLFQLLQSRNNRSDLDFVSLGPNGEYCIRCKNGRMWWGGMTNRALDEVAQVSGSVKFIDFGGNDSYIVRYTSS